MNSELEVMIRKISSLNPALVFRVRKLPNWKRNRRITRVKWRNGVPAKLLWKRLFYRRRESKGIFRSKWRFSPFDTRRRRVRYGRNVIWRT